MTSATEAVPWVKAHLQILQANPVSLESPTARFGSPGVHTLRDPQRSYMVALSRKSFTRLVTSSSFRHNCDHRCYSGRLGSTHAQSLDSEIIGTPRDFTLLQYGVESNLLSPSPFPASSQKVSQYQEYFGSTHQGQTEHAGRLAKQKPYQTRPMVPEQRGVQSNHRQNREHLS